MLWTGFSLRLSLYFGALRFSSSLTSPSVPAAEEQLHSMSCFQHTSLLGRYSAGDEQSWFPSNMMLGIEVHQTRESGSSQSEGPLGVFSCVFTEQRTEFGHTRLLFPRSVECCSDVCLGLGDKTITICIAIDT